MRKSVDVCRGVLVPGGGAATRTEEDGTDASVKRKRRRKRSVVAGVVEEVEIPVACVVGGAVEREESGVGSVGSPADLRGIPQKRISIGRRRGFAIGEPLPPTLGTRCERKVERRQQVIEIFQSFR